MQPKQQNMITHGLALHFRYAEDTAGSLSDTSQCHCTTYIKESLGTYHFAISENSE